MSFSVWPATLWSVRLYRSTGATLSPAFSASPPNTLSQFSP